MTKQGHLRDDQTGFILATSLIFLVVLTLLAVTAISSATLQQRMAANQSDKAALLEDANSALSYVSRLMAEPAFLTCFSAKMIESSTAAGACPTMLQPLSFRLSRLDNASPNRSLRDAFWAGAGLNSYQPVDDSRPRVQYVVEYLDQPPLDSNATVRVRRFRVTARARQPGSEARGIAQMIYEVAQ